VVPKGHSGRREKNFATDEEKKEKKRVGKGRRESSDDKKRTILQRGLVGGGKGAFGMDGAQGDKGRRFYKGGGKNRLRIGRGGDEEERNRAKLVGLTYKLPWGKSRRTKLKERRPRGKGKKLICLSAKKKKLVKKNG